MNKLITIAALTCLAGANAACNESTHQDALDVQSSRTAIAKDNAAIAEHEADILRERGIKADAKARGDYGTQAASSLKIGAHKAGKAMKQGEKNVDEAILEENEKDLRQ